MQFYIYTSARSLLHIMILKYDIMFECLGNTQRNKGVLQENILFSLYLLSMKIYTSVQSLVLILVENSPSKII